MPKLKSRDGKIATTFWMDKELKDMAQARASMIKATMTDIINRSVKYYLDEGYKLDEELGQKIAAAGVAMDIKESGKYEMRIAELEQMVKGLTNRIANMEDEMTSLPNRSNEALDDRIKLFIRTKMDPIIEQIAGILSRLPEYNDIDND